MAFRSDKYLNQATGSTSSAALPQRNDRISAARLMMVARCCRSPCVRETCMFVNRRLCFLPSNVGAEPRRHSIALAPSAPAHVGPPHLRGLQEREYRLGNL